MFNCNFCITWLFPLLPNQTALPRRQNLPNMPTHATAYFLRLGTREVGPLRDIRFAVALHGDATSKRRRGTRFLTRRVEDTLSVLSFEGVCFDPMSSVVKYRDFTQLLQLLVLTPTLALALSLNIKKGRARSYPIGGRPPLGGARLLLLQQANLTTGFGMRCE